MTNKADVFIQDRFAGILERTSSGASFVYDPAYLSQPKATPVSTQMPLKPTPYLVYGINLHPYFANLLPEGLRLDAIASRVKTSRDDRLSLLVAAGEDAIGDVSIQDPTRPRTRTNAEIDPTYESFQRKFEDIYGINAKTWEKVSLAGVQEKVSASRISAMLKVRNRQAIVKLNFDQIRRPRLVQNEHFFMQMAKSCGLEVAENHLVTDSVGDQALVVIQFDRIKNTKLHQEDACQFLDLYPDHKYGVSMQQIAKAIQQICSAPIPETLRLIELYAFSYLIGNGDLHAKNISVLTDVNGLTRLSPTYDLLSTWPYKDHRMALKLDGRDRKFTSEHFVRFGARFGVPEKAVRNMLARMVEASEGWATRVGEIGFADHLATPLSTIIDIRRSNLVR